MSCDSCGNANQRKFLAEIDIHFSGLGNADQLPVQIFPEVLVCFNCGKAQFSIPKDELDQLAQGIGADGPV